MVPVRIEALAGEQTGLAQKQFSKSQPLSANASKFGVMISGHRLCWAKADWSSLRMKITLGFIVYPFTAPAVRPLIMYFWKKKNTKTMGNVPTTEMELTRDQS